MSVQTEAQLESALIRQLGIYGVTPVSFHTDEELTNNFRETISAFNDIILSDTEFARFLHEVKGKGVHKSAKMLRDKVEITRDDNTKLFIKLYDGKNPSKNIFQVTNQVTVKGQYKNRFDVTVLVNGLPVIQIELKRVGNELKEAFNQINRYRRENSFVSGLFDFVQLFIISNGVNTKYFANAPGTAAINWSQTFTLADVENNYINFLDSFAEKFLTPEAVTELIFKFMIVKEKGDKSLIVMRPYQIFAAKAVYEQATKTNNNGYIWHSTGSGKTLTCFKSATMLTNDSKFKLVLFVVDRTVLDDQSVTNFNGFEEEVAEQIISTKELKKKLIEGNTKLIVTTVFKLSNALDDPEIVKVLKDENIAVFIDECHRSQFGKMHKNIVTSLNKAQYFGFTGTPRFEQNKSDDGRTTVDIFGRRLHTYMMVDAIRDCNVLPLNLEYMESRVDTDISLTRALALNENRIELVTKDVVKAFPRLTLDGKYNAIFATDSISMLRSYYAELRKGAPHLKIAAAFSYTANEETVEENETGKQAMEGYLKDYNTTFNTNFTLETRKEYIVDVTKRMETKQIDLLLVVDMFLTGFDSVLTNTLFYDKKEKDHNLIQSISRTNRVHDANKQHGNVRFYQAIKAEVDSALKLFSQIDSIDSLTARDYDAILADLRNAVREMKSFTPTVDSVDRLSGESDQAEYVRLFRSVLRLTKEIEPRYDYDPATTDIGASEDEIAGYTSKYVDLHHETINTGTAGILPNIDFQMELIAKDTVNVDYINSLIRSIKLGTVKARESGIASIKKEISQTTNEQVLARADLYNKFLDETVPLLSPDTDISDALDDFIKDEYEKEIKNISDQTDIPTVLIRKWIVECNYTGMINRKEITASISKPFLQKKKDVDLVTQAINSMIQRY